MIDLQLFVPFQVYPSTFVDLHAVGEDYNVSMTGDVITFLAGSSTTEYNNIILIPDGMFEGGNESFTLGRRATGSGGVVISQSELTISIIEDDGMFLNS